jgi:hypothetical protein
MFRASIIAAIAFVAFKVPAPAFQDPKPGSTPIEAKQTDDENAKLLERFGLDVPKLPDVLTEAEKFFALAKDQQTIEGAEDIAKKCNKAANYLDTILEEYRQCERDNYRYDRVVDDLQRSSREMRTMKDRLLSLRNNARFLCGEINEKAGNPSAAFFAYREAFRLSPFEGRGLRYQAEQKMKAILGVAEMASYEK